MASQSKSTEKILDKRAFMERLLGDGKLAHEIISLFLSKSPEQMAGMREAAVRGDAQTLLDILNDFWGVAGNFGAKSINSLISRLEAAATRGKLEHAKEMLSVLDGKVVRLRQELGSGDGNSQRRTILVADDDRITRRVIERTLVKWGYEPISCSNGKEALELLLRADGPTIAILDWMMPGLEGVQVCHEVRNSARERYVYMILLTAKQTKEDLLAGLEAGADAYLTKPFDPDELKLRLNAGIRMLDSRARAGDADDLHSPAIYDFASRLWSEEAILDALGRELGFSQRDGSPVGVVLLRVGSLERIREKLGAGAVESALKEVVRRMIAATRPYDYVGTYGPESFLIIARSCSKADTHVVAERLRSSVSGERIWTEEGAFPVRIALGATVATGSARTGVQSVLQAAENALCRGRPARGKTDWRLSGRLLNRMDPRLVNPRKRKREKPNLTRR